MFYDTHAHINLHAFKDDAKEVMHRSFAAGIGVINVGTELATSRQAVEMLGEYLENVYAVVGLHPSHTYDNPYLDENERAFTAEREEFDYEAYKALAQNPRVVGIGECGLDFYRIGDPNDPNNHTNVTNIKELQKVAFLEQIRLALELDKALVIHCRPSKGTDDAYEDTIQILSTNIETLNKDPNTNIETLLVRRSYKSSEGGNKEPNTQILNSNIEIRNNDQNSKLQIPNPERRLRFEVHSFTGNLETAQKFLDLGGYIGLNGIVTFGDRKSKNQLPTSAEALAKAGDKTGNMEEVVKGVPLDRIVLETDAPYLAPTPFRGKRNEPSFILEVAKKIATLKGVTLEEVENQTTENAKKLFKIKI